jgi:hypothetical protein
MIAGRSYESAFVEREEVAEVSGLTATQEAPCEVSLKVLYTYNYLSVHTDETGYKKVVGTHFLTFLYPVFTISS